MTYAILSDVTPARATVERILTADEVRDLDLADQDPAAVLAVASDATKEGERVWLEAVLIVSDWATV